MSGRERERKREREGNSGGKRSEREREREREKEREKERDPVSGDFTISAAKETRSKTPPQTPLCSGEIRG